jgi:hypothetical protein
MEGKPFQGMYVFLTPDTITSANEKQKKLRKVETTSDGAVIAQFSEVEPGRYYVEASRLGVTVGPGTVIVSEEGSSDSIAVRWPGRNAFTVVSVAGRLQHHSIRFAGGSLSGKTAPLADTKLTLSRIDSEKEIGSVNTDLDGNFDFHLTQPGAYLLHVQQKTTQGQLGGPLNDHLLIFVDTASPRIDLRLQVAWTSCGMAVEELR